MIDEITSEVAFAGRVLLDGTVALNATVGLLSSDVTLAGASMSMKLRGGICDTSHHTHETSSGLLVWVGVGRRGLGILTAAVASLLVDARDGAA